MLLVGRLVSQLCGVMLVGTWARVGAVGRIGKSVTRSMLLVPNNKGKGGWGR